MKSTQAALLIRLMGWGFIIFGVIFVSMSFSAFDGFAQWLTIFFDWTGTAQSEPLTRSTRWLAGIMSGLSAGFGAFFVFVIAPLLTVPNLQAQHIAKKGGLIAALVWFFIDSLGSYAAGVPSNVAMNLIFLSAFLIPLVRVKFEPAA